METATHRGAWDNDHGVNLGSGLHTLEPPMTGHRINLGKSVVIRDGKVKPAPPRNVSARLRIVKSKRQRVVTKGKAGRT
jgi:hypothetical protein